MLLQLAEAAIMVAALSVDSFISCFAYGAGGIRIPFVSVLVIDVVCALILAVSVFFGNAAAALLPEEFAVAVCFVILLILGAAKIFDSAVKALIRKHSRFKREIRFSAFNLGFILNVYADPEEADKDGSKILSPSESAYLAVALSLDGLAVGFGAGMAGASQLPLVVFSLLFNLISILLGCASGYKIAEKLKYDIGWIGGAALVFLAFLKVL